MPGKRGPTRGFMKKRDRRNPDNNRLLSAATQDIRRVERAVEYADIDAFRRVTIKNRGAKDLPKTDAELEIRMHRTRRLMAVERRHRKESEDWLIERGLLSEENREVELPGAVGETRFTISQRHFDT